MNPDAKCKMCPQNMTSTDIVLFDDSAKPNDGVQTYLAPLALNLHDKSYIEAKDKPLNYDDKKKVKYCLQVDGNKDHINFVVLNKSPIKFNINGLKYKLDSFHFHDKVEHRIKGVKGAIEVHFVFEELCDTNVPVPSIVALVFICKKAHESDKVIKSIKKGKPFKIPEVESYITYPGTLTKFNTTVPPDPVAFCIPYDFFLKISKKDLKYFRKHYCRNSSEPKPRNGRIINIVKNDCDMSDVNCW